MFDWIQTEITKWTGLIPLAIVLVGGWAILHTFHKTRAIIPVLGVAFATGLAAWAAGNIAWISTKIGSDAVGAVSQVQPRGAGTPGLVVALPSGTPGAPTASPAPTSRAAQAA
jgi:hypothetical protein